MLTTVLSWFLLPVDEANIGRSYGLAVGAAVIAFVLSMVQSFRRTPSPALILGYAAFEGVEGVEPTRSTKQADSLRWTGSGIVRGVLSLLVRYRTG